MLRDVLDLLIADFEDRPLPELMPREGALRRVEGKASVVAGMRRAGKTWCCYEDMQALLARGVEKERLLYLNFEDERLLPFTTTDFDEVLSAYYRRRPGLKDVSCYLYLDEVQRVPGWEMFVRRVIDGGQMVVTVTGSSSRLLSTEIATSLRGRSLTTEVFPFSFAEFVRFHHPKLDSGARLSSRTRALLQAALDRYRRIGGFPEVQTLDADLRRQVLRGYLDVVILRDVVERYRVTNIVALRSLLRHALSAPARPLSVNRLYNALRSQAIACTKNDLYEFLHYLADAYLLYPVPIHSRSERTRQVNPRKVYAVDPGLLGATSLLAGEDRGPVLENLVYLHLRRGGRNPEYLVTGDGFEVDFVLPGEGGRGPELIQVCWSLEEPATQARELRGLKAAMKEFGARRGTVVTWLDEDGGDPSIAVVPAWKWLLGRP